MFRRPKDDPPIASPYKSYGAKKAETPSGEIAPRIFDAPPQSLASPLASQMDEGWGNEKTTALPHPFKGIPSEEEPETTLGEGVTFRGELSFERMLRIDGTFEGKLLSEGKVVVGPTGKMKADLNLREAIIEGEVEGNITCQERVELRGKACIYGDIQSPLLLVDEGVKIIGNVHVDPGTEPDVST